MHKLVVLAVVEIVFPLSFSFAQSTDQPSPSKVGSPSGPTDSTKGPTTPKKEKNNKVEPKTPPDQLPNPTFGIYLEKDAVIVDALKLVENKDGAAALAILKDALGKKPGDAMRDELVLAKAIVSIRSGIEPSTHVDSSLTPIEKRAVADAAVENVRSVPRRAGALLKAKKIAASNKMTKDNAPASPQAWLDVLQKTGMELDKNLQEEHNDFKRAAELRHWNALTDNIDSSRKILEQMETIREACDSGLWAGATTRHASTLRDAVNECSKIGTQLKNDLPAIRSLLQESPVEPGCWWPHVTVNRWNETRSSLEGAVNSGTKLIEHFKRAKSKWGRDGNFGDIPVLRVSMDGVEPEKCPARRMTK